MGKRRFTFGQATDKGNIRESNQDAALSLRLSGAAGFNGEEIGLFMVADGMGGKGMAEEAARLAIHIVTREIVEQLNSDLSTSTANQEPPAYSKMLVSAFQKANAVIEARNSREWVGCATGTAVLVVMDQVYIAHVGETKAFIFSQNRIESITIVHDLWHEGFRRGFFTKDDLMSGRVHAINKLYRAFGITDNIEVDITTRTLEQNELLLLCCDGIWKYVDDNQIQEIILLYPDPQEACEQLIATAKANDSSDNMTAIMVRING